MRALREGQELTQQDLAEQLESLGLTRDKIAKIERGLRPTSVEEAVAISAALKGSVEQLLLPPAESELHQSIQRMTRIARQFGSEASSAMSGLLVHHHALDGLLEQVGAGGPASMRQAREQVLSAQADTHVFAVMWEAVQSFVRTARPDIAARVEVFAADNAAHAAVIEEVTGFRYVGTGEQGVPDQGDEADAPDGND